MATIYPKKEETVEGGVWDDVEFIMVVTSKISLGNEIDMEKCEEIWAKLQEYSANGEMEANKGFHLDNSDWKKLTAWMTSREAYSVMKGPWPRKTIEMLKNAEDTEDAT